MTRQNTRNGPWLTLLWSALIIITCIVALAACGDRRQATQPCQQTCTVPGPVPRCSMAGPTQPCVDEVGDSGLWVQASSPAAWPVGTAVDAGPLSVPLCQDAGPCVGMWTDGSWRYVPPCGMWPDGDVIDLCPTEDGGPWPCAWVPLFQGNGVGDAGALVYLYGTRS